MLNMQTSAANNAALVFYVENNGKTMAMIQRRVLC